MPKAWNMDPPPPSQINLIFLIYISGDKLRIISNSMDYALAPAVERPLKLPYDNRATGTQTHMERIFSTTTLKIELTKIKRILVMLAAGPQTPKQPVGNICDILLLSLLISQAKRFRGPLLSHTFHRSRSHSND